jgi:hypothetical protein
MSSAERSTGPKEGDPIGVEGTDSLLRVAQRTGIERINWRTLILAGSGRAAPAYLETTLMTLRRVSTTSFLIEAKVDAAVEGTISLF